MKKNGVIWIIDDDPGILEAVTMILEEENYLTKRISDEKILDQELKKRHSYADTLGYFAFRY